MSVTFFFLFIVCYSRKLSCISLLPCGALPLTQILLLYWGCSYQSHTHIICIYPSLSLFLVAFNKSNLMRILFNNLLQLIYCQKLLAAWDLNSDIIITLCGSRFGTCPSFLPACLMYPSAACQYKLGSEINSFSLPRFPSDPPRHFCVHPTQWWLN